MRLRGLSTVLAAVCKAQECSSGGLTQLGAFPIKNGLLSKLEEPTLVILGPIANSAAGSSLLSQVFSCPHDSVQSSRSSTGDRGSHCTRSGSCVAASLPCSGPHTQVTCACCPHMCIFRSCRNWKRGHFRNKGPSSW